MFLATALVLVLSPGPDTVLVLSRTLATGRAAGLMTAVGTQTGNIIHALLAGLGVSGVILLLPFAFDVLKYLGAAYLVYLAIITWRAPTSLEPRSDLIAASADVMRYFRQGLTNNLANPKMIPFFIALFPQFVRPDQGAVALQSLMLGATLAALALVWLGTLVIVVGQFRAALAPSAGFLKLANRLAAVTFLGLACRLLLEQRRA